MPTLQDGRNAIAQGNLQQARLIFEALLQENPRYEEAWLGLAEVLTDTEDKRICYENALKINKNSRAAREGLRSLEPRADPLVAALAQQTMVHEEEEAEAEDEFELDDEATLISARTPDFSSAEADSGPSTVVLVVVGLALSVVVFAIGGGVAFFVITSLVGG